MRGCDVGTTCCGCGCNLSTYVMSFVFYVCNSLCTSLEILGVYISAGEQFEDLEELRFLFLCGDQRS